MDHSLVIDAQGLGIWRHRGSLIERESLIDASDETAQVKMRDWLDGARRRCTLVIDLADERHVLERLPRTSGADRRQLIARRLAQRFPDTALTSATPLPVSPEDGLLEPMLFAALTRPPLVTPWLDTLSEAALQGQAGIRNFTSVPFLLEHWYRHQRALPAQCLLLLPGAGGMRQLFFRQRRLSFSRVVPARSAALETCLPTYRDELMQTLAWLSSQRLTDAPPPIRVFAPETELPLLRELASVTNGDIDFIAFAQYPGADGSTDTLTLALRETRRRGTSGYYGCPQLQRPRQIAAVRRSAMAFTLTAVAASLGAAASDFIAANRLRQETERLAIEHRAQQNELDSLNAEIQRVPQIDSLPAWLDQAERLARTPGIVPAEVLQAVAGLLAETPWARLESLNWKMAAAPDGNGNKAQNAPDSAPSASIGLEISLSGDAPPLRIAADRLAAGWQQRHNSPMQARVDSGIARLWLDAMLSLDRGTAP